MALMAEGIALPRGKERKEGDDTVEWAPHGSEREKGATDIRTPRVRGRGREVRGWAGSGELGRREIGRTC